MVNSSKRGAAQDLSTAWQIGEEKIARQMEDTRGFLLLASIIIYCTSFE